MNRIFVTYMLIVAFGLQSFSQKNADLGVWLGGSYYLGDLNTAFQFKNTNFAGGAFYKYNYNARYSLKAGLLYAKISGSDNTSKYVYQKIRGASFSTPIYELTAQGEFNFLKYSLGDDRHPYSTYTFAGLSLLYAQNSRKPIQLAIPIGVGFKFNIGKKWGLGIEYGFRKTFTDHLDNLAGIKDSEFYNSRLKQFSYLHDNDWYSLAGVFATYKVYSSGGKCRAYDY